MKKIIFITLLLLIFFSCSNENPFPKFKPLENECYMRLISFEEETSSNQAKDVVIADIKVLEGTTVLYRNYKEDKLSQEYPFKELIQHLNEGDSAIFKVSKRYFYHQFPMLSMTDNKDEYLEVSIKIHHFYSATGYKKIAKIDEEMKEQIILKKYLAENNIDAQQKKEGIYIVNQKEGEGNPITSGNDIQIKYRASFTNYLQFDDLAKKSFKFTYGTPDQVIKGLEIALKGMRKGEKSKIIITSQFAFGEEGSSTGIVPPYTTVIYDLEIINVN